MTAKFIDISEHNTILSFGGIADSNLKGVIIKATEGTTYIDHSTDINYEALKGSIPIGFYHYLTSTSSPITQAQNFWDKIRNKEYEIIPILDVEQESLGDKAEKYAYEFMQEFFRLSGQEMLIYSGRCYIEEHFSEVFKRENFWWVADYSANECPVIEGCSIVAWQYTEDCKSYAFAMGNLDCNELIDENNFYLENHVPFSDEPEKNKFDVFIYEFQTELNQQGFKDKNGNSLVVDGIAGELTLSACPTLRIGAKGNITEWLQCMLMSLDLLGNKANDGIFGEKTRQAVITFQENMSLVGDGIVGKNTWRKLLGL